MVIITFDFGCELLIRIFIFEEKFKEYTELLTLSKTNKTDYVEITRRLKESGYDGGISIRDISGRNGGTSVRANILSWHITTHILRKEKNIADFSGSNSNHCTCNNKDEFLSLILYHLCHELFYSFITMSEGFFVICQILVGYFRVLKCK